MAGLGLLASYGLVHILLQVTQLITFILVALFLALGLEPLVSQLCTGVCVAVGRWSS